MSSDNSVGAYMAPPIVALYMAAPVDCDPWQPGKYEFTSTPLPSPEEMKQICLDSTQPAPFPRDKWDRLDCALQALEADWDKDKGSYDALIALCDILLQRLEEFTEPE